MSAIVVGRIVLLPFAALDRLACPETAEGVREFVARERVHRAAATELADALFEAAGDADAAADAGDARARLGVLGVRRAVHNDRNVRSKDLRKAESRLNVQLQERVAAYSDERASVAGARAALQERFAADLDAARERALELAADPVVAGAIRLASRSLADRIARLAKDPRRVRGHDGRHVVSKLAAYVTRHATKTTPNGLFCATAIARIEDRPDAGAVLRGHGGIAHADALLSIAEARKVAACLAADPAVEAAVRPRANPTIRERDGAFTLWTPASYRRPEDDEVLARAPDHPVLRAFVEVLAGGGGDLGVAAVLERVSESTGFPVADLRGFFDQLVERGIVIAEIQPPYNERRPLAAVARAAREADVETPWIDTVERIERDVDRLANPDAWSSGEASGTLDDIAGRLEALPHVRELKTDEIVRVDAASGWEIALPRERLETLERAVGAYASVFSRMYPAAMYVEAFAGRFLEHFEADTDVPLLDLYHGVYEPHASAESRPVSFPRPGTAGAGDAVHDGEAAFDRVRARFAAAAAEVPAGEALRLTASEFASWVEVSEPPPFLAGALFQIAAEDAGAVARGEGRIVLSGLFPGAGLAVARFAHLHDGGGRDGAVVRELRRGWRTIEREGAIVAELTYTHTARTANAALRPSIFEHEIELPGERASAGARVIHLRDLTVRFDAAARRFVLRWPARAVEVLPVITSGVNPVGVISFLVAIGQAGFQPVAHFPGFDDPAVDRWPRVEVDGVVLFRERRVFRGARLPPFAAAAAGTAARVGTATDGVAAGTDRATTAADGSAAGALLDVAAWGEREGLPRRVFVSTDLDPKPWCLDFASPLGLERLRRTLAPARGAAPTELWCTEVLPGPSESWVRDERGAYAAEFLVQLPLEPAHAGRSGDSP